LVQRIDAHQTANANGGNARGLFAAGCNGGVAFNIGAGVLVAIVAYFMDATPLERAVFIGVAIFVSILAGERSGFFLGGAHARQTREAPQSSHQGLMAAAP
jgi:hypothetical protein